VETLAELVPICNEMLAVGLPKRLAITAMAQAVKYEGLRHLLTMWYQEQAPTIRDEVVADIAELLEDLEIEGVVERLALRHRDIAPLMADARAFKDALRRIVDEQLACESEQDSSAVAVTVLQRCICAGTGHAAEAARGLGAGG
jgi:hypothetical protein